MEEQNTQQNEGHSTGKRGGVRPGAGRPKGAKSIVNIKKALKEYISENELAAMVKIAKEVAKKDKKMLMFILEQVFGKARGTVGIDGGENKPIAIGMLLDSLESSQSNQRTLPPIKAEIIQDANRQAITGQKLEDPALIQD